MLWFFLILPLLSSALPHEDYVRDYIEVEKCPRLDDCRLNCALGYAVNADGCEVCECSNKPCTGKSSCSFPKKFSSFEKTCEEMESCHPSASLGIVDGCPNITCQTFCEYGYEVGNSGCPICICKKHPCMKSENQCDDNQVCVASEENCQSPPCHWTSKCVPKCRELNYVVDCLFGNKRDENGCETYQCKKDFCDGVTCPVNQECVHNPNKIDLSQCVCKKPKCDLTCPLGLARDKNGCQLCECVADPCQTLSCNSGFECRPVQMPVCLEKPCPYTVKCFSQHNSEISYPFISDEKIDIVED